MILTNERSNQVFRLYPGNIKKVELVKIKLPVINLVFSLGTFHKRRTVLSVGEGSKIGQTMLKVWENSGRLGGI